MIIIVVQFSLRPRPPLHKSSRAFTHTKPRFWGKRRKRARRRLHRSLLLLTLCFFDRCLSVCFFFSFACVVYCVVCCVRKFSLVRKRKIWSVILSVRGLFLLPFLTREARLRRADYTKNYHFWLEKLDFAVLTLNKKKELIYFIVYPHRHLALIRRGTLPFPSAHGK